MIKKRYQTLPKVNLHHHLEGAVRPSTFFELVQSLGLSIPVSSSEEAARYLQVSDEDSTLADFLVKVDRTFAITKYPGILKRVAYEAVEDAYHQNVRYLEIRFGPWSHVQKERGLEAVIGEVLAGIKEAMEQYPIEARLIVCALRHDQIKKNLTLVEVASNFIDYGLVGFDIAGDEAAFPANIFADVFRVAKSKGLGITVHAGEVGSSKDVYEAITILGAQRIGHGIQIAKDAEAIKTVKKAGITLEVCPTSNVDTGAVTSLSKHPIRDLFNHGVKISLGDDDPTTSKITISSEYEMLAKEFAFSSAELRTIVLNGAKAAFLPDAEKKSLVTDLEIALDQWQADNEN